MGLYVVFEQRKIFQISLIFLVYRSWLDYSSGLSVDTHIFKNSEKGLQLMKFYSYLLNNEAKANIYDLVVANVQTFGNQLGIYFSV